MKILWKGKVFNPTGIATAGREYVNALKKLGHQVQVSDPWHDRYDFNAGKEDWNNAINVNDKQIKTIYFDYPINMLDGFGKLYAGAVHEGTKLIPGWSDILNKMDYVWVPSNATKNLFKWNGVNKTIFVIPHGFNPEVYYPRTENPIGTFTFLSVNSWTGQEGDRKGTDLLIKAFDEEFKPEEDVKLLLKFGTFWQAPFNTMEAIKEILGHVNANILVNDRLISDEELANYYRSSDCFVAPTRGEGFGLTLLNALASGMALITTKDNNSGHMDFCKNNPGVLFVKAQDMKQGDPRFYVQGNMLAEPDIADLRKQMRWAFENRQKLHQMGKQGAEFVKDWTWENAAKKIIKMLEETNENS